jgi:hypothetical protein
VSQLSARLIALIALAAVAGAVGLISTGTLKGKSGGGGDPAAQQVIERAFNNSSIHSGRFNASFSASAQGRAATQLGNRITANMSGAFNDPGNGRPSQLDLTFSVNAPSKVNVRVVSTGKAAFISIGGRTYKATAADFARVSGQLGRPEQQLGLAGLGVDPKAWMRNIVSEGTASVGGVPTDHVSAGLDADKLTSDLSKVANKLGQSGGQGLSAKDAQELKDALGGGRLDLYASKRDGSLRRLQLHVDVKSGQGSGALDVSVDFTDVNRPQKIIAPESASTRPISQIESDIAAGFLSPDAAAQPVPETPAAPASGAPATAVPPETQGYLGCVRKATTQPALQRCSALLP